MKLDILEESIREETSRLRLNSHQDVLSDIDKMIQNWNQAVARQKLGAVKGYIQGKWKSYVESLCALNNSSSM
jgi:hypothetical protein